MFNICVGNMGSYSHSVASGCIVCQINLHVVCLVNTKLGVCNDEIIYV